MTYVAAFRALRSSAVWPELVEEWREIEKPAINTLAADLIYTRVVEVTNARITPSGRRGQCAHTLGPG